MATTYERNADGLMVRYGAPPKNVNNRVTGLNTLGSIRQMEIDVDLVELGAAGNVSFSSGSAATGSFFETDYGDCPLPAYASVMRAYIVMNEAATSGGAATLSVGTYTAAGAVVDADAILTPTAGTVANMGMGERTYGDGALVATTAGTASTGADRLYVALRVDGAPFTAGKGRLIIEYMDVVAP